MAGEDGFYLMHRGWQDHPVFRNEAFSRRDAFVWLIEEGAYRDRRVAMPEGEVTLLRGQIGHSFRFMAKAWKWDESKVRRFVTSLVKAKIIDAAVTAGQTVLTICNYDKYQAPKPAPAAPVDAAATQHRRSDAANEKEGKEVIVGVHAGAREAAAPDADPAPAAKRDAMDWVNRFGVTAGVAVFPSRPQHFADQIAAVSRWLAMGLDPETEIIPALQRDAEKTTQTRHSLAYFDATMAKIAAKKAIPDEQRSDPSDAHANPLTRVALRRAAARDRG